MRRKVDFDNRLSGAVIAAAIAVHRELGPGLDETHYQEALSRQLTRSGIGHEDQAPCRWSTRASSSTAAIAWIS